MRFYELEKTDISNLNDGDLRELVARLPTQSVSEIGRLLPHQWVAPSRLGNCTDLTTRLHST